MFSSEIKWQNPDTGPFHHAEHRLLSMLSWHWQWQYFSTFVISHAVTLLNLSNCFLSRFVCFTIKKKHLVHFLCPPGCLLFIPSPKGEHFCILNPPLGLMPYPSLFYPYLSARKGSSAGFVISCKGSQDILQLTYHLGGKIWPLLQ